MAIFDPGSPHGTRRDRESMKTPPPLQAGDGHQRGAATPTHRLRRFLLLMSPPSTTGGRYSDRLAVAAAAATTTIPDPDRPTTLPRRGRSTVLAATPLARYPMPPVAPLSTGAINRATGIGHANGRLTRYHPHVTAPAKQVRAVPLTPAGTTAAKQPRSSPPAPPPSPAAPTQATPAKLSCPVLNPPALSRPRCAASGGSPRRIGAPRCRASRDFFDLRQAPHRLFRHHPQERTTARRAVHSCGLRPPQRRRQAASSRARRRENRCPCVARTLAPRLCPPATLRTPAESRLCNAGRYVAKSLLGGD